MVGAAQQSQGKGQDGGVAFFLKKASSQYQNPLFDNCFVGRRTQNMLLRAAVLLVVSCESGKSLSAHLVGEMKEKRGEICRALSLSLALSPVEQAGRHLEGRGQLSFALLHFDGLRLDGSGAHWLHLTRGGWFLQFYGSHVGFVFVHPLFCL